MEMETKIDDYIKLTDFIKFCKVSGIIDKSERTLYRYCLKNRTQLGIEKLGKHLYILKKNLLEIMGFRNYKSFEIFIDKINNKKNNKKRELRKSRKVKIFIPSLFGNFDFSLNDKNFLKYAPFIEKEIKLSPEDYTFLSNEARKNKLTINKLVNQYIMLELLSNYIFK